MTREENQSALRYIIFLKNKVVGASRVVDVPMVGNIGGT